MLAAVATLLDNPLLLEWHNAAAVFHDPVPTHIGLALLTHQLGYFDILPLYVVLMLMAPGFARHRPLRAATWCCRSRSRSMSSRSAFQIVDPDLAGRRANGSSIRSPGSSMFVLGFVLAREDGIGGFVRRHIVPIRWLALPIVVVGLCVVLVRLVARSDQGAAAAAVLPDRQDLRDAAAHDPVPGADRGDVGDLSLHPAIGCRGWSTFCRCSGAIRSTCSASARS